MFHIQYPVGQGGLHLGIIGNIAYVYDCGALPKANCVRFVDELTGIINAQHIDAVYIFISHLHDDHCNAIKEILDKLHCQQIHVYVPYLSDTERLLILGAYSGTLSDILMAMLFPRDYESVFETGKIGIRIHSLRSTCKFIIGSNIVFDSYVSKGVNPAKVASFIAWAKTNIDADLDTQKVKDYVQKHANRRALKKAYETHVDKDLNLSSLCLYCGPDKKSDLPGVLHTGDYNLKKNGYEFFLHYRKYFINNSVQYFQIPHHGSAENISYRVVRFLGCRNICLFFFTGKLVPGGRRYPSRDNGLFTGIANRLWLVSECVCSVLSLCRMKKCCGVRCPFWKNGFCK